MVAGFRSEQVANIILEVHGRLHQYFALIHAQHLRFALSEGEFAADMPRFSRLHQSTECVRDAGWGKIVSWYRPLLVEERS